MKNPLNKNDFAFGEWKAFIGLDEKLSIYTKSLRKRIADIHNAPSYTAEEREAYATLIAAAPDMLKALNEAKRVLHHFMDAEIDNEIDLSYKKVIDAIQKATSHPTPQ